MEPGKEEIQASTLIWRLEVGKKKNPQNQINCYSSELRKPKPAQRLENIGFNAGLLLKLNTFYQQKKQLLLYLSEKKHFRYILVSEFYHLR